MHRSGGVRRHLATEASTFFLFSPALDAISIIPDTQEYEMVAGFATKADDVRTKLRYIQGQQPRHGVYAQS